MSKTAFIIGITGQDGAYLAQLLLDNGYKVVGVTRDILDYKKENLEYLNISNEISLIELSCLDKDRIVKAILKLKPDEVYNLAAQSSVGMSFIEPFETINYNIFSVLNWLEAIKTTNLPIKFYQASSSEMFGNVSESKLPLKESLLFHPASPYGVSKASAHWLAVNYRESNNIFSACGILFNHESPLRGEGYVVKKIINAAVKIKLGLAKDKISVGNTSIRRDWGYAPKYVEAMCKILQHDVADDFLICSGNVMSLDELIDEVMKNLNLSREEYLYTDESLFRPVDLEVIYGDNTKARRVLNWDYNISNTELISQLIKDEYHFIEWEQRRKN
ncbi:MAG: GDP-mannose 4,6-dehydratase [Chitinophagaceae bacterium]